jgi:hypothetical protein
LTTSRRAGLSGCGAALSHLEPGPVVVIVVVIVVARGCISDLHSRFSNHCICITASAPP